VDGPDEFEVGEPRGFERVDELLGGDERRPPVERVRVPLPRGNSPERTVPVHVADHEGVVRREDARGLGRRAGDVVDGAGRRHDQRGVERPVREREGSTPTRIPSGAANRTVPTPCPAVETRRRSASGSDREASSCSSSQSSSRSMCSSNGAVLGTG
jgi:hypothetical protein